MLVWLSLTESLKKKNICIMIGIMFTIIPPGPIKKAPRAIKSDCEHLENPTFF